MFFSLDYWMQLGENIEAIGNGRSCSSVREIETEDVKKIVIYYFISIYGRRTTRTSNWN